MLRTSHQTEQAKTDKNVIKTCNLATLLLWCIL